MEFHKYTSICCESGPYPPFPESIGKEDKGRKEERENNDGTDTPNKNETAEDRERTKRILEERNRNASPESDFWFRLWALPVQEPDEDSKHFFI